MGVSSYRGLELPGFNGTCNLSLRPLLKLTLAATFSVICALYGLSKKHTGHKINLQPVEHGNLNKILHNDTSLAVLTFKDWTFYLLKR